MRFVGLDPGKKAMFGGVEILGSPNPEIHNQEKDDKPIYVPQRRKKFKTKCKEIDHIFDRLLDSDEFQNINTKDPRDFRRITKFRLKVFEIKEQCLLRPLITQLKWNNKIRMESEIDSLVNFIVDDIDQKPTFVVLGQT